MDLPKEPTDLFESLVSELVGVVNHLCPFNEIATELLTQQACSLFTPTWKNLFRYHEEFFDNLMMHDLHILNRHEQAVEFINEFNIWVRKNQ